MPAEQAHPETRSSHLQCNQALHQALHYGVRATLLSLAHLARAAKKIRRRVQEMQHHAGILRHRARDVAEHHEIGPARARLEMGELAVMAGVAGRAPITSVAQLCVAIEDLKTSPIRPPRKGRRESTNM